MVQSQPCHWRNLKTVAKRDVSNQTLFLDSNSTSEEKKDAPLSDNISLFQSLRVLQEGEGEELNEIRSKILFFVLLNWSTYHPLEIIFHFNQESKNHTNLAWKHQFWLH